MSEHRIFPQGLASSLLLMTFAGGFQSPGHRGRRVCFLFHPDVFVLSSFCYVTIAELDPVARPVAVWGTRSRWQPVE